MQSLYTIPDNVYCICGILRNNTELYEGETMSERERMCSSEEVLIDDLEHATNREIRSVASRILHSRLRLQNSPCLKEDSQLYAILRSISAHGGNTEDIRPIRNYDDILNESKEQKDYWSKRGQLCNLLYRLEERKTLYKYNDDSFK